MDQNMLIVSPSPHDKGGYSIEKIMYGVIIALMPALFTSIWFFGIGAVKVIILSTVFSILFEFLIQKFLIKGEMTVLDGSGIITGILLGFNLPSTLPIWMVAIGSLVAVGIGKMAFGGLGKNPFNPALIGRVFLLISFPVQMTNWAKPMVNRAVLDSVDVTTGATPLAVLKEGVANGDTVAKALENAPSYIDMFIGNSGGSLGEISALAILVGGIYMLYKKIITWHIPVSFILTIAIFSGVFWLIDPTKYADPIFHIITGGVMLGAFFMATDMVTSPMTPVGMLIFGVGCGLITIIIRMFGAYPEGVSFAILIMNCFVPLIDKQFKPRRFGKEPNYG